jgi:hypothetical protein
MWELWDLGDEVKFKLLAERGTWSRGVCLIESKRGPKFKEGRLVKVLVNSREFEDRRRLGDLKPEASVTGILAAGIRQRQFTQTLGTKRNKRRSDGFSTFRLIAVLLL